MFELLCSIARHIATASFERQVTDHPDTLYSSYMHATLFTIILLTVFIYYYTAY